MERNVLNFNAGPAALPSDVMSQLQTELLDLQGSGLSILEISHRSKLYEDINEESMQLLRDLLNIPSEYEVLFLQGGASTQFAMVPINFLIKGSVSNYIYSGTWSGKAISEARKVGKVVIAGSSESCNFTKMPDLDNVHLSPNSAYIHLTSNETVAGTQYSGFPDTGQVPLIADMSSDILSRKIDISKFSLIYAGAQKNIGPSGVTVVIVKRDMLSQIPEQIPDIMNYRVHANSVSLYHTPPVFAVYIVRLVLKWIKDNGGVVSIEEQNRMKAALLYDTIDQSDGFYNGLADIYSRSMMNVTFGIGNKQLEGLFLDEANNNGFVGLKGHRDAGHMRASIYNAVSYKQCEHLVEFMRYFQGRFG
ncbi:MULTISPECIES: 3-phosphoserine/phosphohydroxythreonine transaminase [unclassified Paenibacillus]|uniref:3-phosphoserine/phosphohydroxythreonine transaminase n=1 Tax=unclassified Paenibacillus TaxID=185978 RepID=UPI0020B8C3D7|nr:3-phosphoserine/phosphohydroxythreonine transaminase [Paenibacillus sp. Lou8.1]MCP3809952.1 3-phosphoserine/phosphohydroxythreonine transaminase [Paenibacillus sp. Lou8.1]